MKKIGWQGHTRTKLICDLLNERLKHWREGWFGSRISEAHVVVDDLEGPADPSLACWHLGSDKACMWFEAPSDVPFQLADVALQVETADRALAKMVGESCLADLCLALWGDQAQAAPRPSDPPDGRFRNPRYGGTAFRVLGLPFELRLLADRGWGEQELPRQSAQRQGLVDRRTAIGPTRLSVMATVELGEIPLLESTGWASGELLVTDASHVLPVNLVLSGRTVRTAILGKRPGPRTIEIS